ncbi:MAG: hypothetical protein J7641_05315 [Cyanobacteria bacterium SID2]|nr:hypothetical protein [Cyanobacteria bacterium SID2]
MSETSSFQKLSRNPIWQRLGSSLRQSTSVAVLTSIGLHGILGASLPLFSWGFGEEVDREIVLEVEMVELAPEDSDRSSPFGFPSENFDPDAAGLPSLSGRASFPPPPPDDSEEIDRSSIFDRWRSWDDFRSQEAEPDSDRDSSRPSDSSDYWDAYREQWQDWLDRNSSTTTTQPQNTAPTQPDPQVLAKKKRLPSEGTEGGETDDGEDGKTTDETTTTGSGGDGFGSGEGYERGNLILDELSVWIPLLSQLDERLSYLRDSDTPLENSKALTISVSPIYQNLENLGEIYVLVIVSPEGYLMTRLEIPDRGFFPNPLPLPLEEYQSQYSVLQPILKGYFENSYEGFEESDRPKIYPFFVTFAVRGQSDDGSEFDRAGTSLDSKTISIVYEIAKESDLSEEQQNLWIDFLELSTRELGETLSVEVVPKLSIPYPANFETSEMQSSDVILSVVLNSEGQQIENGIHYLQPSGYNVLDNLALRAASSYLIDNPEVINPNSAYLFTVEFSETPPLQTPSMQAPKPKKEL